MGSFANSVFNLLMGWVRAAAVGLWQLISGQGSGNFFIWIGENWVGLVIAVCAVCTVIDVVVHLIRWRPYKVWASFFRRLGGSERRSRHTPAVKEQHKSEQAQETEVNQSPEQEAACENEPARDEAEYAAQPAVQRTPEEELAAYRSRFARPAEQSIAYRRPPEMDKLQYQELNNDALHHVQGPQGYPQPAEGKAVQDEPAATQQMHTAAVQETQVRESLSRQMRRRMTQLQKNLGMTEDDAEIEYRPAQPIVNKDEMYHAPVYPPNWKEQQATQVTPRRRRQHSEINTDA